MAANPWIVSVLSTDYDLHDYRTAVINELKSRDITVSAFEEPDFPVEPGMHSHKACLTALDRVDIAILLIDKRFGGIYFDSKDQKHSITEEEFLTVATKEKPYLVFVSNQTWDERHKYTTELIDWGKKQGYSKEEIKREENIRQFDEQYVCAHVDSVQTIKFVESIHRAYDKYCQSNWITQYSDIDDLVNKVQGKLKGLSRYFIERIVCEQAKKIGNRHTSTGFSLSLRDVIEKGYYLEPSFCIESGGLEEGEFFGDKIKNTLKQGASALVYGEAGYGKTTVLAKSYFEHVDEFLTEKSYQIPFYLWLKEKNCDYHFNVLTYIEESFLDDLGKKHYPYLDITGIQPIFYVDGFDEIAEKMLPDQVERISRTEVFQRPVLLTCRYQYARRYINNFSFSEKFSAIVRIESWTQSKAIEYIETFCRVKRKESGFAKKIQQLITDNEDLASIINSPLLLTMLLWIVEQNRMQVPENIRTRIQLFRTSIHYLAKRELARLNLSEKFVDDLVHVWAHASWDVYFCRLKGREARLSELIARLKKLLPQMPFEYYPTLFEALFDSADDTVFGTFHEQFLEYLVACAIFNACQSKEYPYPDFLQYVMRPEINRYFRGIWNESTEEAKEDVVENLQAQYMENAGKEDQVAISKRVHAVYHVCRLDSPKRSEFIQRAFGIERHLSVLLSLFFGAIKIGDLEREQEFYDLLIKDQESNLANRGYHLAYYSDAIMGGSFPFFDDNQRAWKGTLEAILRHFKSLDENHYFLRRIELLTMQQFIQGRNTVDPLTEEIIAELSTLISNSPHKNQYTEFQKKIETAFENLKSVYNQLISK